MLWLFLLLSIIDENTFHILISIHVFILPLSQFIEWYYFFNLPQKLDRMSIHTTSYDSSWVSTTDQAAQFQLETLHSRLLTAQSHLAKEAVRSAYISLANFHKSRGFLKEAFSSTLKARDYCTTHLHTAETYLQAVELCFDMKSYGTQLHSFVRKLQQAANGVVGSSTSTSSNAASILTAKVAVVYALSLLQEGNYSDAANQLVSISIDLTNQFNSVISAEDVVLYSVLLGLATFDRRKVQRVFFPDTSFHSAAAVGSTSTAANSSEDDNTTNTQPFTLKQRLELVPWISDAILYYVRAQYGNFLSLLEQHKIELQLDLRISPHLDTLYHMIRNKCILQYIAPYSSMDFRSMRRQFDVNHLVENSQQLEDFVANLITTGGLPHARINLQHGTIVTKKVTPQRDTMRRVELLGDRLLRDVEAILLRMSCFQQNIVIQVSSSLEQQMTSSSSPFWQQRKPSSLAGTGSQVLLHPHLGQVHDMYYGDENDVSSDSNNTTDELQDDVSTSAELQDDAMYVDDGNEAAMMMDISDMIENAQSA
jgi:COP9 signalosome complex subunit 1